MFKSILWLSLFCSVACAKQILPIQHWTTANGTQVYFVAEPSVPMVDIQLTFTSGSSRDSQLAGLTKLTNDALATGTGDLDATGIANAFASLGAQYSHGISRDTSFVKLRSLSNPDKLNPALSMLAKIISTPSFPEKAFKRLQKSQLQLIKQASDSPREIAKQVFYQKLYANVYNTPKIGTKPGVEAITLADIKAYHRHYYVARNAILAIVGDLTVDQAKALADKLTSTLAAGEPAPLLADIRPPKTGGTVHVEFDASQTAMMIGTVTIRRHSPDYFPLIVGNYTLGGGTLVSRLSQEVREKRGLAYQIGSQFTPMLSRGPFVIILGTKTNQVDTALEIVNKTLNKFLEEGPTAEELKAAKQFLMGNFPVKLDSNAKITATLSHMGVYNLPLDYLDTYREKINAVTLDQIKEAFDKHIDPKQLTIIKVGKHAR